MTRNELLLRIFKEHTPESFLQLSLDIFNYQIENNSFYRSFVEGCKVNPESVKQLSDIPFLPVELFKTNEIKTGNFEEQTILLSSETTGRVSSTHFVK